MSLQARQSPQPGPVSALLLESDHQRASDLVDALLPLGLCIDWVASPGEARMLLENASFDLLIVGMQERACGDAAGVIAAARRHAPEMPVVALVRDRATRSVVTRLGGVVVTRPADLVQVVEGRVQCEMGRP